MRPLEGIRVLEWGVFHAGPGGSALLREMGAEVIKIEQPLIGDPSRKVARYKGMDFKLPDGGDLLFAGANRGKKSITLNLEHPRGREIAYNLVKKSDVFFTNIRRIVIKRMQMDYPTLSQINPKIIYSIVTGYGTRGADSNQGVFDYEGQARSGLMYAFGEPGTPPVLGQFAIVDQATAIMASYQTVIALFARERFGIGQEVDVSLLSTASSLLYFNHLVPLITGQEMPRHEQASAHALRNFYRCSDDKWIAQTQRAGDTDWPEVCGIMGLPELTKDSRFDTQAKRLENSRELVAIFNEVFATKTRDEWMRLFSERGLIMCPVNTATEAINDPQMIENDYVVNYNHPRFGQIRIPGFPIHFSNSEIDYSMEAPKLGEHTDSILKEIGYNDIDINNFRETGVI